MGGAAHDAAGDDIGLGRSAIGALSGFWVVALLMLGSKPAMAVEKEREVAC